MFKPNQEWSHQLKFIRRMHFIINNSNYQCHQSEQNELMPCTEPFKHVVLLTIQTCVKFIMVQIE